jgi:hypothetical protein
MAAAWRSAGARQLPQAPDNSRALTPSFPKRRSSRMR